MFVEPEYRRGGLARRLYEALKTLVREEGVEVLYLHTHPFLPGTIEFWPRQGFVVVDVDRRQRRLPQVGAAHTIPVGAGVAGDEAPGYSSSRSIGEVAWRDACMRR